MMTRRGGSISVRLSVGFMLVLAVFGVALLVTLYNFGQVTSASEEIRVRQQMRREAQQVGLLAEELYKFQQEFVARREIDWDAVHEFLSEQRRMEEALNSLLDRDVAEPERGTLERLGAAAVRLRNIFLFKVVPAKVQAVYGAVPSPGLDELQEQTQSVLDEMGELNERLAFASDSRAVQAEGEARTAWSMSLTVAKTIFPLALLMSLLIIYYTHRSIVRPVGSLLEGTQALAQGNLQTRIEAGGAGEFQYLAESFNRMAGALQANQKQLIEAEKMASVGRLAAGIAHEINNPIAVILGYTKMLLAAMPDDAPEKEQIETVEQEARQCKSIVDGLLDMSRPSDPTRGEVLNPNDVIAEVINMMQALQLTENVEVEDSVLDKPLPLAIARGRLRQLAVNIVRNGLEALRGCANGRLKVEGYLRPRAKIEQDLLGDAAPKARSFLLLSVSDNGPGIRAADRSRLFEPFFTTKADGTGLGLAIARSIARAHGGFIDVQSRPGEGTTFTVGLPLAQEPA